MPPFTPIAPVLMRRATVMPRSVDRDITAPARPNELSLASRTASSSSSNGRIHQHGPEDLLLGDGCTVVDADDHGGLHKVAATQMRRQDVVSTTAGGELGTHVAGACAQASRIVLLCALR